MKHQPTINIHNQDCMEAMAEMEDNAFDLAIVDPEYGISVNSNMGRRRNQRKRFRDAYWDKKPADKDYFNELFRVSKNQLIFGGNYFNLGPCKHFVFWDKRVPEGLSFSDGEMIWTSFEGAVKKKTMGSTNNQRIHPTQKPVALYKWLLKNYATEGDKILDTHLGSGSIAIACHDMGFDLEAYEIDQEYHQAALQRLNTHRSQLQMF